MKTFKFIHALVSIIAGIFLIIWPDVSKSFIQFLGAIWIIEGLHYFNEKYIKK